MKNKGKAGRLKTAAALLGAGLLLGMTGCAIDTEDEIKERAELIETCKNYGGDPYINMLNNVGCNMDRATEDD